MLTVPGLRPEKVLRLFKVLDICSLAQLEAAAKDDRIKKAKGLGAALQNKILQNLAIAKSVLDGHHTILASKAPFFRTCFVKQP